MRYMPDLVDARRRALNAFLIRHRLSARAICRAAGLSPAVVSQFVNVPGRDMIARTWEALAAGASTLLGRPVSVAELQGDRAEPGTVEAVSFADGRAIVVPLDQTLDVDAGNPPDGAAGEALLVRDNAAAPTFEAGDMLWPGRARRDVGELVGRVVVAQLADGSRLVRRLLRGSHAGRFDLQAVNAAGAPLADQAIVEAAPIRWIRKAS
jgi:hypothetical protein